MNDNKLSDEQRKLIDHLMNTNLSKNTAICLVFIASREETKSREIENATRLRQPEVSIAMQDLRERE
ncbi:MAG: ArsR family transcriptional regulator, partial [Thermoplasmatota archaeon]